MFHPSPAVRRLCLKDIQNFSAADTDGKDVKKLLEMLQIESISREYIRTILRASGCVISLLLEDFEKWLNVIIESLRDTYNVQILPEPAKFNDVPSLPIHSLYAKHREISSRLLIDVRVSDFALMDPESKRSPTFLVPPFLEAAHF